MSGAKKRTIHKMLQLSTVVDYVIGEEAILRHFPKAFVFSPDEVDSICEENERVEFSGIKCGDAPTLVAKAQLFSKFNFPGFDTTTVLAVKYVAGDRIGPHSDNESRRSKGAPIVNFSFGETRNLTIKRKKRKRGEDGYQCFVLALEHGSAYAMLGDHFQTNYTHEVGTGSGIRHSVTVRMAATIV